jgi:hypothetical protein
VPDKMTDNIIHTTTCNCPVCTLIAHNVTIMDARITILKNEGETAMSVPIHEPYLAIHANHETSMAIRDIVCDYHYGCELKVGESSFRSEIRYEMFVTRTSRYKYVFCFHTRPALEIEPTLEGGEIVGD